MNALNNEFLFVAVRVQQRFRILVQETGRGAFYFSLYRSFTSWFGTDRLNVQRKTDITEYLVSIFYSLSEFRYIVGFSDTGEERSGVFIFYFEILTGICYIGVLQFKDTQVSFSNST